MKIGFSNIEAIVGFSENCFVREEGQVFEKNIFYKVSSQDFFRYCNVEVGKLDGFISCVFSSIIQMFRVRDQVNSILYRIVWK